MAERDYVLGTDETELQRLGLQHAVWRPRALDAWRRAGFNAGQKLIDFGAGPGYAAHDLADITGKEGRVVALERSTRFVTALRETATARMAPIEVHECDLAIDPLPVANADGAWARWIFAFLPEPRAALEKLVACVRPGGAIVVHEYWDYGAWSISPRSPEIERFVDTVISSWRATGGEPNVGRDIPRWLSEMGCDVREVRPLIDIVSPRDFVWRWPAAFVRSNLARLVEIEQLDAQTATQIERAFTAAEADIRTLASMPLVAEVIAYKR